MILPYAQEQPFLLPPNLEDLLPEGHLARVISEVVDRLDLSQIIQAYNKYAGRPGYHPALMLKVLFYGYATGVRSSRQLARRLESDVAFMWLAGRQRPDFRTLSNFRKDHLEAIKGLFVQLVRLCRALGMVRLGHVSLDGTKVKANASKGKVRERGTVESELEQIRAEVEDLVAQAQATDEKEDAEYGIDHRGDEIPEELKQKQKLVERLERVLKEVREEDSKAKVNLTDPEAKLMKRSGGGFELAYNAQAAADSETQVIVACGVSNEPMDTNQLEPLLSQIWENTGGLPRELSADTGYYAGRNLEVCNTLGIDAYIPEERLEGKGTSSPTQGETEYFPKEKFTYNAASDTYLCPGGKLLTYSYTHNYLGKYTTRQLRVYRGAIECSLCPLAIRCTPNSPKGRTINRDGFEELRSGMREKLKTEKGRKIYSKRKCLIEAAFGQIKGVQRMREFLLRGLDKVRGEWTLTCLAHNLRKIWAWLSQRGQTKPVYAISG